MTGVRVTSFVATSYVRDLDRSRAFYQALGFVEGQAGRNERAAWSSLDHHGHGLLLVTSEPPFDIPQLPLHFYFYVEDIGVAGRALEAIGHPVILLGNPPHALGGEAKTLDPDGNTVLLGQIQPADAHAPLPDQDGTVHFSLLKEAAALAAHRAGATTTVCEVPDPQGTVCPRPAEVKLADAWGDTAWACIPHAEDALINARNTFIANRSDQGLGAFLATRRRRS